MEYEDKHNRKTGNGVLSAITGAVGCEGICMVIGAIFCGYMCYEGELKDYWAIMGGFAGASLGALIGGFIHAIAAAVSLIEQNNSARKTDNDSTGSTIVNRRR